MDEEAGFNLALDAHPEDMITRAVYADWLEERDDPRAPGYRELILLRKFPRPYTAQVDDPRFMYPIVWYWGHGLGNNPGLLPRGWFDLLPALRIGSLDLWRVFESRREAEDAAASTFPAWVASGGTQGL